MFISKYIRRKVKEFYTPYSEYFTNVEKEIKRMLLSTYNYFTSIFFIIQLLSIYYLYFRVKWLNTLTKIYFLYSRQQKDIICSEKVFLHPPGIDDILLHDKDTLFIYYINRILGILNYGTNNSSGKKEQSLWSNDYRLNVSSFILKNNQEKVWFTSKLDKSKC
jgi:hypothetical protein